MRTRAATLEAAGEVSGPAASMARMADCFGAPVLLVFGFEDCLAPAYATYDTASLVQNVCLAAHDKGLGTCQSTTLVRYPGLLRERAARLRRRSAWSSPSRSASRTSTRRPTPSSARARRWTSS